MTLKCKHCGKPLYRLGENGYEHERRSDLTATGGRRATLTASPSLPAGPGASAPPASEPPVPAPPELETPPKREHFLHRVIGGKKKEGEVA